MQSIATRKSPLDVARRAVIAVMLFLSASASRAVTLIDFDVAPAESSILVGQIQAFSATGRFSDGATRRLDSAALALGSFHSCVLQVDGSVRCWGANGMGQLGGAVDSSGSNTAVVVSGVESAVAIGAGISHSCITVDGGRVRCWGWGTSGQLGDGKFTSSAAPVEVGSDLRSVTALGAGGHHTCALRADGTLACWGANNFGQLGIGTDAGPDRCEGNICSSVPVDVVGIDRAVGAAAGRAHTCAVLSDGTVRCWGSNSHGQLGIDPNLQRGSTVPVTVPGVETATAVALGTRHSCALLGDGTVRCWGNNFPDGELGDGTLNNAFTPVAVAGVETATAITAGSDHSCALMADGAIQCWGDNTYGQLGNGGAPVDSAIPADVSGVSGALTLSAGAFHTCALRPDPTPVVCWGRGREGQIGNGDRSAAGTPEQVLGVSEPIAVTASHYNSCALQANGTLSCWGDNSSGQLSIGTDSAGSRTPLVPLGIDGAVDLAAEGYPICVPDPAREPGSLDVVCMAAGHACVARADGSVRCWGANNAGQVGVDPVTSDRCGGAIVNTLCSTTPVTVDGIEDARAAGVGDAHSCALLSDGRVHCWGGNGLGQLGDGTRTDSFDPVTVDGLADAVALAVGALHACALLSDGRVACWGGNASGQIGAAPDGPQRCGNNISAAACATSPVIVAGLGSAIAVSAGGAHSCALLADGSIRCWGENGLGQLGDGTQADSHRSVAVVGITDAVALSAGDNHSCAVRGNGRIRCWGSNDLGQLGIPRDEADFCALGPLVCKTTPVPVEGMDSAVAVSAGGLHTCAISSDHTIRCWGWNGWGQFGNGTTIDSFAPVAVAGPSMPVLFAWRSTAAVAAGINTNGIATGLIPDDTTIVAALTELDANGGGTRDHLRHASLRVLAASQTLSVDRLGAGTGRITSSPAGIDCGGDCSQAYDTFAQVSLTAIAGEGAVFVGFGGHADCADGVVTMNAAIDCTATFAQQAIANSAPEGLELVDPADGATGLPTEVTFAWAAAADPDGDTVSYQLCLRESDARFQPAADCASVAQSVALGKARLYARLGYTGVGLFVIGALAMGKGSRRTRAERLAPLLMVVALVLTSCGGGKGGSGVLRHTVSGLSPAATYFWQVVAEDGAGGRTESETRSFITG